MTKNKRMLPNDRRAEILVAALNVAERTGFNQLTREQVAIKAGCAESLVSVYFGTMIKLKRDIMRVAVRQRNLTVIAQGLAVGDKHAKKADKSLQSESLQSLI